MRGEKNMNFSESETKLNLMRAFAGESQARNRYTFAAEFAREHGLYIVSDIFLFTANQELAHANVFYTHLKAFSGENITITGGYPVEVFDNMLDILETAKHDELSEYESVYKNFAEVAKEEGFSEIAASFQNIAKIEKVHSARFDELLKLIKEDRLFKSDDKTIWFCTNCGHIQYTAEAPEKCPVCSHDRGYFLKRELIPYTCEKIITV